MQSHTTVEFILQAGYQQLEILSTEIDRLFLPITVLGDRELFIYNVKLAIHEIGNNIIEHAYCEHGGTIRVQLQIDEALHLFMADLWDTGRSFDPLAVKMPDLDKPQEQGYGLYLVNALMDEVQYDRQAGQNHWHIRKRWSSDT